MSSPAPVLAIDLGTSGPKTALVASDGSVHGAAFEPVDLILLPDGGAEQDPGAWWAAIGAATRRTMATSGLPEATPGAVVVTGQWSGTVAVDADGAPLTNAIIWMDTRGARPVEELMGGRVTIQGYDPRRLRRWIRLTGGAPSGSGKDPIAHIAYLRSRRPDLYARAAMFLEPKDFVNLRLTGTPSATFDSIALHWVTDNRDPDAVAYDDDLLAFTGLERSRLPDLHPAGSVVGHVTTAAADALGIPAGIPVLGGTPDLHSAAIGAGTTGDFAGHLYIGTSSWITCHVPFKKTDLLHNIASLPAAIPGRYLVADEQETAGKALDWLAELLYPDEADRAEVYEELNRLAASVPPGSRGVVFTPWLVGERTPVEDATLRGGFFNQSLDTGRAEMIRAVFEGVAFNARWLLRYVERFTKRRLDPIVMVGGGARSALWGQIHADVLGRTVLQAEDPILVNVRGAGLLGQVALGTVRWEDVPTLVPMRARFEPDHSHAAVYNRLYDAFRRIHEHNRKTYRRLNR